MANITDKVAQIRQAVYGKDVRESIASGIEAINTEVESTTQRQTNVETLTQQAIDMGGNPSLEVSQARGEFSNLGNRLNNVDSQLEEKSNQLKSKLMLEIENGKFKWIAHRGMSRVYSNDGLTDINKSYPPENSLSALYMAADIGKWWGVELDARLSLDNVWVCSHDDSMVRTHGVSSNISEINSWTFYNANYKDTSYYQQNGTTLAWYLQKAYELNMNVIIDVKLDPKTSLTDAQYQSLYDAIVNANMIGKVIINTDNQTLATTFREKFGYEVVISFWLSSASLTDDNLSFISNLLNAYCIVDVATLTDTNIAKIKSHDLVFFTFSTLSTDFQGVRYYQKKGLRGIVSNGGLFGGEM